MKTEINKIPCHMKVYAVNWLKCSFLEITDLSDSHLIVGSLIYWYHSYFMRLENVYGDVSLSLTDEWRAAH